MILLMEPRTAALSLWWEWGDGMPSCFGGHFPDYLEALNGTEFEAQGKQVSADWNGLNAPEITGRVCAMRQRQFVKSLNALLQAVGLGTRQARRDYAVELTTMNPTGKWHVGCHPATAEQIDEVLSRHPGM